MALRDWLNSYVVATAIPATTATKQPLKSKNIATVAKIAVAEPPESNKSRVKHQDNEDLPNRCPLLGGPVPNGCRFESKFFKRMMTEGVLPLPDGCCPLRHICGLKKEKE